jgi:hypothetical protein
MGKKEKQHERELHITQSESAKKVHEFGTMLDLKDKNMDRLDYRDKSCRKR